MFFLLLVKLKAVGIRYGKYCGVGWTGCPGEKPCDDVDACCKIHDECVGNKGISLLIKQLFLVIELDSICCACFNSPH